MSQKISEHNCAACRFLVELDKEAYVCRRYPPELVPHKNDVLTIYPMINNINTWWCGEWQHKFSEGAN